MSSVQASNETAAQSGTKMTSAEPGSARGLYLIVSDIQAARDELAADDPDGNGWRPAWYAEYMVAEQAGTELPT